MNHFKEKFVRRFLVIETFLEKQGDDEVYHYVLDLKKQMDEALSRNADHDFWTTLPKMLSIDSKLSLLEETINLNIMEEFCSGKELINMIEKDYRTYYKERYGYKVNEECPNSLIFYIE